MAARRVSSITSRTLFASCRQNVAQVAASPFRVASVAGRVVATNSPRINAVQVRWHSAPDTKPKVYDFDAVKSLSDAPDPNKVLIDVREPAEFEAGYIPNAINIPVASAPDALFMPAHEFEDKFGFEKPAADKELVFYCKAGVRSSAAAQLAQQLGYKKVSEYRGSWLDWQKNGGKTEK